MERFDFRIDTNSWKSVKQTFQTICNEAATARAIGKKADADILYDTFMQYAAPVKKSRN
jgi:hypothetical protein